MSIASVFGYEAKAILVHLFHPSVGCVPCTVNAQVSTLGEYTWRVRPAHHLWDGSTGNRAGSMQAGVGMDGSAPGAGSCG